MGSENSKSERQQKQSQSQQCSRGEYTRERLQQFQNSNNSPVPQQQPNLERSRAPYSYTHSDLSNAIRQENSQRLYPNLENVNRNFTNENKQQNNSSPTGMPCTNNEEYVIINQHQQRVHLKPSAPPADESMGLSHSGSNSNSKIPSYPRFGPSNPGPSTAPPVTSANNNKAFNTRSESRFGPSNPGPSTAPPAASANNNKAFNTRSESRTRSKDINLNCPTCAKRLGLTIYNCMEGHGSCRECREGKKFCGKDSCGAPIIQMRNFEVEKLVAVHNGNRVAQCQNENCTLRFDLVGMEKHLKECPFGEMDCPMGTLFEQCSHRCKVDAMASHFDECHKDQRVAEFNKEMYIFNIHMQSQKLYLIKNGPYNFLVHIKVAVTGMIYMAVQLIGTAVSASKWTYEFHVYNKRQPRRKFQFIDNCQSIGTPINSIFAESKCATIPVDYGKTFVNDSTLTYKFFIKKTDTRPRRRNNQGSRQAADVDN